MANPIVQQINAELDTLHKELSLFKSTIEYLNGARDNVHDAVLSVNDAKAFYGQKIDELKSTYKSFMSLVDSVNGVVTKIETINFPERLDNIEKAVKQTITSLNETRVETIDELQRASEVITSSDFEGKFKRLNDLVDDSIKSNLRLGDTILKQNLPEKINGFEKNIKNKLDSALVDLQENTKFISEQASKSIQELNLPIRFDKLDANISGIITTIQNFQARLESLERNIFDKIKDSSERQLSRIDLLQNNSKQDHIALQHQIKSSQKKQNIYAFITWLILIAGFSIIILTIK